MASINKIDLSSITNNSSDVYDIDATTLDGSSISDFAFLDGENHFTGSENYFTGDLLRVVSPSESDLISLWADGDGFVIEHVVDETDHAYSRLKMHYSSGFLSDDRVAGWYIGAENDWLGDSDNLELYTDQLFMTSTYLTISANEAIYITASQMEVNVSSLYINPSSIVIPGCSLEVEDYNDYEWQLPYHLYIGSTLALLSGDVTSEIVAASNAFNIRGEGSLRLAGGNLLSQICLSAEEEDGITNGTITISTEDNDQGVTSNISMHPNHISISANGGEGEVSISAGMSGSYINLYDDNLTLRMECETGRNISHFNAYTIQLSAYDTIDFNVTDQEGSVSVTGGHGLWINGKEAWHKGNLTFKVTDNGTTLEITSSQS